MATPAAVEELSRETVTVAGSGSAEAVPDLLVASFGSEVQAGSVAEALDGTVRSMAEVIARLRAGGVGDLDLNTGSATIWSAGDEHGRVVAYTASQRLTAKLRDLASAGALVGEAVVAGGDAARLFGLSFALADTRAVDEWARVQAWQNARAKAGQLASLAGRTLGPVIRMRETSADRPPTPYLQRAVALSAASPAVPLEPGAETVTVSIEVEWAFLS